MSAGSNKFAAALPFVLPVLGGLVAVLYVTWVAREANPFLWIVVGVIAGRLLASLILRITGAADYDATFSLLTKDKAD